MVTVWLIFMRYRRSACLFSLITYYYSSWGQKSYCARGFKNYSKAAGACNIAHPWFSQNVIWLHCIWNLWKKIQKLHPRARESVWHYYQLCFWTRISIRALQRYECSNRVMEYIRILNFLKVCHRFCDIAELHKLERVIFRALCNTRTTNLTLLQLDSSHLLYTYHSVLR